MRKVLLLLVVIPVFGASVPLFGQENGRIWPRFRGVDGSGHAPFVDLPLTWDAATGENIRYKTPLRLPGANSPVIWHDRVFVTGADEAQREVYCLDAHSGELLWTTMVGDGQPAPRIHAMTGFAAPTGTTDGEAFYAVFPTGYTAALDFSGNLLWERWFDMSEDIYGHASSLILADDLLIVQNDLGKPRTDLSYMVALDRRSGETVWQVNRPVQGSWTTPIIIESEGRRELITSAKPWVIAYDPATGEELWRVHGIEGDSAPSPVFAGGHIYIANIYATLKKIRPGGSGDVTASHLVWSVKGTLPDITSPLATAELVFVLATHGALSCHDARDGSLLWRETPGGRFRASPSLVGERLYVFNEAGEGIVVAADRQYSELGRGRLNESVYSTPAFAHGRMYVRGETHLFCIAVSPEE